MHEKIAVIKSKRVIKKAFPINIKTSIFFYTLSTTGGFVIANELNTCSSETFIQALSYSKSYFATIKPNQRRLNKNLISLGKNLFSEKKLSFNSSTSCMSCHGLDNYGVDGKEKSIGLYGEETKLNSPTVLNVSYQSNFFWDGRSPSLEDQALQPIFNPIEMGMKGARQVEQRISKDKKLVHLFNKAFPYSGNINIKNVAVSISEFERSLVYPSKFDRFLNGEQSQISHQQAIGMIKFVKHGCATCHSGPLLGGELIYNNTSKDTSNYISKNFANDPDIVTIKRLNIKIRNFFLGSRHVDDNFVCKISPLRNISKTAPYFNEVTSYPVKSLKKAIEIMYDLTTDFKPSNDDLNDIESFLDTLTSESIK